MKHSIYKLLPVFITLTVIGCAQLSKQIDTIKPTAKVTGTRLANISFDQVDLVFDLAVENKNPVSLQLAGLEYDLTIENRSLVSGTTAQAIELKANTTSPVQLPITLKFDDLKKLPGELWNRDKITYQLLTKFKVDLPVIGNYAIPVNKKGELPVPKIPDIKIKDVKLTNLGFTSAELIALVEVSNPNDFDLGVRNFNYQLNVNQQNWGQGKINKSSNIPKKGKGIVEIPVKLNMMSIGTAAFALLKSNEPLHYQLKGNATLDSGLELLQGYDLPVDIKGTTSLR